jgi:PAS domain S-box-containing protein
MPRERASEIRFGSSTREGDQTAARKAFAAAVAGHVAQYETVATLNPGIDLHARVTLIPFLHEGEVLAVLGMARDIEELTEIKQAQRLARQRLSSTLNAISDGLFFMDHDWVFTYLNPRAEQIVGQTAGELIGRTMWDSFPGMYGSEFGIAYRKALAEKRTITVRDYYEGLDRWLEASAYPTDEGIAVYVRDVNDEEVARRALVESERRSASRAALLDVARDAIAVRGLDGIVRFWNRAAVNIYGYRVDEAVGSSIRELIYDDPTDFDEATAALLRDGMWTGELRQRTKSGEVIFADCSWTLTYDDAGLPESILSINTNVTERRKQEQLQLRSQRLDSLGSFASGIAHDLNNMLTPVLTAAQVLALDEVNPDRIRLLESIETAATRGAALISQMLMFARGNEGRRARVDVANLLASVENFAHDTLPKNITVSTAPDADIWTLSCDQTEILQVLINLVANARDAMPEGGSITISARNRQVDEGTLTRGNSVEPGAFVVFSVEDTGTGMTSELIEKIFDPFFTTKPLGAGTGLGLATSAAIVRNHGGFFQVYSEPQRGSRFDIYLPASGARTDPELPAPPASQEPATPRGHGELVLIVDDESEIRSVTRHALESYGYRTAMAANGAEALEYLAAGPQSVNVILTDLMMPVMGGAAMFDTLTERGSTVPVVIMSGLAANRSLPICAAAAGFLAKPFTTAELLRTVSAAVSPMADSNG